MKQVKINIGHYWVACLPLLSNDFVLDKSYNRIRLISFAVFLLHNYTKNIHTQHFPRTCKPNYIERKKTSGGSSFETIYVTSNATIELKKCMQCLIGNIRPNECYCGCKKTNVVALDVLPRKVEVRDFILEKLQFNKDFLGFLK